MGVVVTFRLEFPCGGGFVSRARSHVQTEGFRKVIFFVFVFENRFGAGVKSVKSEAGSSFFLLSFRLLFFFVSASLLSNPTSFPCLFIFASVFHFFYQRVFLLPYFVSLVSSDQSRDL
ncbi:hypothetical protein AMELA_G00066440 [Ameiurus melas]|uniref:Transmembrane protein n=1 Tax=Ameiurus melas TaxID=219545 RepID=A0A7J6B6W0_AMEME|nr:hypothetical protein AMELA_G00066440 [Ameiurus melas]